MKTIQKKIETIIKHLPDDKIQFMGYIWPAKRLKPDKDPGELRHPTISQCMEYLLGISLWFVPFDFPGPDKSVGGKSFSFNRDYFGEITEELVYHSYCVIESTAEAECGQNTAKPADPKTIDEDPMWEIASLYEILFEIHDDMIKDAYVGTLKLGMDDTIPREVFLEWLTGYWHDGRSNTDELAFQKEKKPQKKIIPVPPDTKWHQLHFRVVSPNRVEITTPFGMEPFHPDDLGFTPKIWELFERFAAEGVEYIKQDKVDISRQRKLLKTVFPGVEGDPIPYERNKGYKAGFHITEA